MCGAVYLELILILVAPESSYSDVLCRVGARWDILAKSGEPAHYPVEGHGRLALQLAHLPRFVEGQEPLPLRWRSQFGRGVHVKQREADEGASQQRYNDLFGHRFRYIPSIALAVGGLVLSSCGASATSGVATTAAKSPTGNPAPKGQSSSKLTSLETAIQSGHKAVFKVTYTSTSGNGGAPETITIEQDPPMSVFATAGESIIDTGHGTYACAGDSSSGNSSTICENLGSSNPMAGVMEVFSPTAIVGELQSVQGMLAAHLAGYSVSTFSTTYAGQPSQCVKIVANGSAMTYCVTGKGILSYVRTGSSVMELTSYSSAVPASDFTLPQGATVQTIPGGTG